MSMNDLFPTAVVNGFGAKKPASHYIPDEASDACLRCKTSFTLFFRRHHCRACGTLICWDCLARVRTQYGGIRVVKVCRDCERLPKVQPLLSAPVKKATQHVEEVEEEDLPLTAPSSPADRSPSPTPPPPPTVDFTNNNSALHDALQGPNWAGGSGLTYLPPCIPQGLLRPLPRLPSIPEELGQHLKEEDDEDEEEEEGGQRETRERRWWPRPGGDDFFIDDDDDEEEEEEETDDEMTPVLDAELRFYDTVPPAQDAPPLLPTQQLQQPVKRVTIVLPQPASTCPSSPPPPPVASPLPLHRPPSFATERLVYLCIIAMCLCVIAHDHPLGLLSVSVPGLSAMARDTVEALHRAEALWSASPAPLVHIS